MLEGVVAVEPVRLRRHVERGVVNEDGPGIRHDRPGERHQPPPLPGPEEQGYEDQAVAHPEQHAQEVPVPGHADGVPVAGQADPGREVAVVVVGRPDAVLRHVDRRQPQPLGAGRAVDVPVQPRVVHEDLQAAADEQDQEQEVDVMGDPEPRREAVGRGGVGSRLGTDGHLRQAEYGPLHVGRGDGEQDRREEHRSSSFHL